MYEQCNSVTSGLAQLSLDRRLTDVERALYFAAWQIASSATYRVSVREDSETVLEAGQ